MTDHTIDAGWIDAFRQVFDLCKLSKSETAIVLSETQSSSTNVMLAKLALQEMGIPHFQIEVPTPAPAAGPIARSTGTSFALTGQDKAVSALASSDFVVDFTVEGLMHARETGTILKGGTARILNISNEHPEALSRLIPHADDKDIVKDAVGKCRSAKTMTVTSDAGSDLTVNMEKSANLGVWGWTDRPGTLAHWPGGIVVNFPAAKSTNGRLVFSPGDINLTFKRYFESEVILTLEDDYVTNIEGTGADAKLMRQYFEDFGEPEAYATSHVGWGINKAARYEALTMYDRNDTNGTELRALAGNFLFSTGANEFANRFTRGHFDLPMMDCTVALDGTEVVTNGKLV